MEVLGQVAKVIEKLGSTGGPLVVEAKGPDACLNVLALSAGSHAGGHLGKELNVDLLGIALAGTGFLARATADNGRGRGLHKDTSED